MRHAGRRGANAVEFSLTFPVFLLMLGGMFQLGLHFFQEMLADEAARQGCNVAAQVNVDHVTRATERFDQIAGRAGLSCAALGCSVMLDGMAPNRVIRCNVAFATSPLLGAGPTIQVARTHERRLAYQ